jgi:SET domain-containing protein
MLFCGVSTELTHLQAEHDDFYFASLGGGLMLDAKHMGSVARFANHSCEPNCELQKWNVLGNCTVIVAAVETMIYHRQNVFKENYKVRHSWNCK